LGTPKRLRTFKRREARQALRRSGTGPLRPQGRRARRQKPQGRAERRQGE
jgi:hypothetical protein